MPDLTWLCFLFIRSISSTLWFDLQDRKQINRRGTVALMKNQPAICTDMNHPFKLILNPSGSDDDDNDNEPSDFKMMPRISLLNRLLIALMIWWRLNAGQTHECNDGIFYQGHRPYLSLCLLDSGSRLSWSSSGSGSSSKVAKSRKEDDHDK